MESQITTGIENSYINNENRIVNDLVIPSLDVTE